MAFLVGCLGWERLSAVECEGAALEATLSWGDEDGVTSLYAGRALVGESAGWRIGGVFDRCTLRGEVMVSNTVVVRKVGTV